MKKNQKTSYISTQAGENFIIESKKMRVPVLYSAIVLLIALSFALSVKAGQLNNKFLQTQWTTEQGLPQNSVMSIAQTPDGYLWIGTFGGLARFDGIRFKVYTPVNTPELKSSRIIALIVDHDGMLWIGSELGGLIAYKDGKFISIADGKLNEKITVWELFVDKDNKIWMGNQTGLQSCTINGCQQIDFPHSVSRIRQDADGALWILSNGKLVKFRDGVITPENILPDDIVNFEINPQGGLWIVKAAEFGLYMNGKYNRLVGFKSKSIYTGLLNAPDGSFWLSINDSLYQVKDSNIEEYKIQQVGANTASQIFIDRENNLWLGRTGDGLIRLLTRRIQTLTAENELPPVGVNSIVENRDGSVWLATDNELFRWQNGKTGLAVGRNPDGAFIGRGSLLIDDEGTLWNGTTNGLQSYNDGKFTLHPEISWNKTTSVNSLFQDSHKNLWFGCEDCGVFVSDRQKITAKYTVQDGLAGNTVTSIIEAYDGSIWLATRNGISCFKDGKFTNYKSEDGLSNEYVRDIYEDRDGTLWFGTYGGGLNRFKDGKFTPITTKDGLFDDIVSRILVDDDDNFWMLGNRGIYSVNRQMLNDFADGRLNRIYCSAYTVGDGMITSEGNGGYQSAGTRTHDGRLWFPMIKGVAIIDPKLEKLPPPKPVIEEVIQNDIPVDISKKVEIHGGGDESLEINYTALSFRKPEQIRFRYRLEGLDEDWTEVGTRRTITFPYLHTGNFHFQLSAANADGIWSDQIAEFEIVVYPSFWNTWEFRSLVLLLICGLLFGIYQYRIMNFNKAKTAQENFTRDLLNAQDGERNRIAAEIHDNLGQQLLIIKNWTEYCLSKTSKKSKIRDQMIQINEMAGQALNDVRSMAKTLSPYHLDKAGLTNTIKFMVKQAAEPSNINFKTEIDDVDGLLSKEKEINIYRIVQESVNNIIKHSNATEARILLKRNNNSLKLMISDNGIGFIPNEGDMEKSGFGLSGMKKRAQMLGGDLIVQTSPEHGTLKTVEFDVD